MVQIKLVLIQGIFKIVIFIIFLIPKTIVYSQELNGKTDIDFLQEDNTYPPFGKKLNFKVSYEHIEKGCLKENIYELEYKKKKVKVSFFLIDSVLYVIDRNDKLIEVCNKNKEEQTVTFDNLKIKSKFMEFENQAIFYEIYLSKQQGELFKEIDFVELLISLNLRVLDTIHVYNKKEKISYGADF